MRRITMRDVAEQAGVSKATVSHVINETRFVEEATKARVSTMPSVRWDIARMWQRAA